MNIDDYNIIKPGHIVEYFPETQTATVKIANDRTYSSSVADDKTVAPGLLYDVPTFTPGGGNYHITFPIKAGDTCLLTFSQFGYDHWFVNNEDAAGIRSDGKPQPWTYRKFDLADGFCQVGWNNIPTAISDYSATDSEWRNVDRKQHIALKEDGEILLSVTATDESTASHVRILPNGQIVLLSSVQVVCWAPETTVIGDLTVTGSVVAQGEVTGNGKALSTHTHTGDSGGTTSAPN
jgi:hypothetical protein